MNIRMTGWHAALLLAFALPLPVAAEEVVTDLVEVRRLLAAGETARAEVLMQDGLLAGAGEVEYDLLLGEVLLEGGKPGAALFAYERVLMEQPDNHAARLKAAAISVQRADARYAEELLQGLDENKLDAGQRLELEKIREAIAGATDVRPLSLRGYLLLGAGADSNVTSGPDATELVIPYLSSSPTQLGTASMQGDAVGALEGGLALQKIMGEATWLTAEGVLHQNVNRVRKDVEDAYVSLNLGVMQRFGQEFLGLSLMGQNYFIADAAYRNSRGGRLSWIHAFADESLLNTYYQQLTFTFPVHDIDNSSRRVLGLSRETQWGEDAALMYGLYAGRDDALNKAHFTYRLGGLNLGCSYRLGERFTLSAAAAGEIHQYETADALYHYVRRDDVLSLGLAADWRLSESLHLVPRLTHLRNASNTALYDYTRSAFQLQLRWEFDNEKE